MSQNMKLIGVKMPPETHDAILQAASLAGISVSQFCRERLERSVKVDPTSVLVRDEFRKLCFFLGELAKSPGQEAALEVLRAYFEVEGVPS